MPYFVYLMANKSNSVLYTGMTNNLERRIYEHKNGLLGGFTKEYNIKKLVYFELYDDPEAAISMEKRIKTWRRDKKDDLINKVNPDWIDVSMNEYQFPVKENEIPRLLTVARDDNKEKA